MGPGTFEEYIVRSLLNYIIRVWNGADVDVKRSANNCGLTFHGSSRINEMMINLEKSSVLRFSVLLALEYVELYSLESWS